MQANASFVRLGMSHQVYTFHATGTGGQSMEKLADSGLVAGLIDITTREVADLLMGGVFAATQDRFGSVIELKIRMPLPSVRSTW